MTATNNELKILMSGGAGLLGTTLQKCNPSIIVPSREEMDVCNKASIDAALLKYKPDVFIHAAAFTSPPRCDENPMQALSTNIVGTSNAVLSAQAHDVRLIYISTDYVFKGDTGMYAENDAVLPQNLYAWSKLGGECAVRTYANALIIRTSFSPDQFPYDAAFIDQYTSRDSVSVIAKLILEVVYANVQEPVIHVGTDRKTVKELALILGKEDVKDLKRDEVSFSTPRDTSFDTTLLDTYVNT